MSTTDKSPIRGVLAVTIDSREPLALARFWQRLLGGELEMGDEGHVELTSSTMVLAFAPVGEDKVTKNRLHLDVGSIDYAAAVAHAVAVGGQPADDVYVGSRWTVLRDPEGNEFCVLRPPDDPDR